MLNNERAMSMAEIDRLEVIREVTQKRLRQQQAAERLGIGVRQVKRLVKRYREQGRAGLMSGHRGKPPKHRISAERRQQMMALVRERYADFGPTLACEKLCR